jgi:hypothetical protein
VIFIVDSFLLSTTYTAGRVLLPEDMGAIKKLKLKIKKGRGRAAPHEHYYIWLGLLF